MVGWKMTKTPDEIKKGLECCMFGHCSYCPYSAEHGCDCSEHLGNDVREFHQQLESQNAELLTKVKQLEAKCHQLERERDALVDIIKYESTFYNPIPLPCRCCKNNDGDYIKDKCRFCGMTEAYGNFEWCGVKEE